MQVIDMVFDICLTVSFECLYQLDSLDSSLLPHGKHILKRVLVHLLHSQELYYPLPDKRENA